MSILLRSAFAVAVDAGREAQGVVVAELGRKEAFGGGLVRDRTQSAFNGGAADGGGGRGGGRVGAAVVLGRGDRDAGRPGVHQDASCQGRQRREEGGGVADAPRLLRRQVDRRREVAGEAGQDVMELARPVPISSARSTAAASVTTTGFRGPPARCGTGWAPRRRLPARPPRLPVPLTHLTAVREEDHISLPFPGQALTPPPPRRVRTPARPPATPARAPTRPPARPRCQPRRCRRRFLARSPVPGPRPPGLTCLRRAGGVSAGRVRACARPGGRRG